MGHVTNDPYHNLQHRMDRLAEGAVESPALHDILKILFTDEEAQVAVRMPLKPSTLKEISKRTKLPNDKLEKILVAMAEKGTMLDMYDETKGKSYYFLPPPIVGFFEFSLMRARTDMPQKQLAKLMHDYLDGDDAALNSFFATGTQYTRTLVHETTLTDRQVTEILPYEKATAIVGDADVHAVSLCYCRHKAEHNEHPCKFPLRSCMTVGGGALTMSRHGLAERISRSEALDLLAEVRELGLVQIGDNVREGVGFICNCCGCCCGLLRGVVRRKPDRAVTTSNYLARVDSETCTGCGACNRRCPIKAITVEGKTETSKGKAVVDPDFCLGCGVCVPACKFDALDMTRKKQTVITPKTVLDKVLLMALERGKLQNYIFDDFEDNRQEFMRNAVGAILNLPPTKMLLASQQLRSKFIERLASMAK